MKNLLIVCLFFLSFHLNAQFSLYGEGGMNYGEASISTNFFDVETKPKLGYFVSFVPQYKLKKKFLNLSVLMPIQFSHEKYEVSGSLELKRLYFRALPQVMYNIKNFNVFGGINLGILLNEKGRVDGGNWQSLFIEPEAFDFGLVGGVKYNRNDYYVVLSYNYGLRNVNYLPFTNASGEILDSVTQKNRNFQIGLGYKFF